MTKFMRAEAARTFGAFAIALLAICPVSTAAVAGALFNTGVDSSVDGGGNAIDNPLTNGTVDSHYVVCSYTPPATCVPASSVVAVNNVGTFPQDGGHWTQPADDPFSTWISPSGTQSVDPLANGFYDYRTSFTIALGTDLSGVFMIGGWGADNCGLDILLNGVSTSNAMTSCSVPSNYTPFNAFTAFSIGSGFVIGTNTLDFLVENYFQSTGNPTGLRVDAQLFPAGVNSVDVVNIPEPITLSFFGAGLAGAATLRRREKKSA